MNKKKYGVVFCACVLLIVLGISPRLKIKNVTEMRIRVTGNSAAEQSPVYTQCGAADVDELTEKTQPASPEEIYADVLDMFYHNIQSGWAEYNEMPSLYGDEFCYLFPMSFSDPSYIDKIGYSFTDLNGDGTDELLIGMDREDVQEYGEIYQNVIYDLYTCMDNQIIHLATSGERFVYQLCEDHTLYYYGTGGAASSAYYHYQLDLQEPILSVLESVHSEPDEGWENIYWYHSTTGTYDPETCSYEGELFTEISEEEASSVRASWPQRTAFPLTYFSEYTPQNMDSTASESQTSENQAMGVLTQEQLSTIRQSLGVPDTLDITVTQSEAVYWDAGQCWTVSVFFMKDGNIAASATVNVATGELIKDILMYSG